MPKTIDKIKDWLLSEIETEKIVPLDGTHDICAGRVECAKSLWNQIKKWEEENAEQTQKT